MLSSKQRAWLRAEANDLRALLQIGKDGMNPEIYRHADNQLRTRELVKITVQKGAEESPRELADRLEEELGADVVQVVGRKIILYRHSKELAKKGKAMILPKA